MLGKICISGYYGFDNFGDETILKILIENLKGFDITVFSITPEISAKRYNVKSVHTFKIFGVIKSLYKCDCLISGGGSLLQDLTSLKSLIYYLFVISCAIFFRKKVFIFAQGIGPINNRFFRFLTVLILKHTAFISVRDENSLKLLAKYNIKAKKCDDPVWNISFKNSNKNAKIGVQLRSCNFINDNFLLKLAQNLNKYFANREILLLSLQNKQDIQICQKFKKLLLDINSDIKIDVIENKSNDEVIKNISELEQLIAMRYHACLIGVKAKVKVLPLNYDIKVKALADEFNLISVNSSDDIDEKFKMFAEKYIQYDEQKIKSKSFDFTEFRALLTI